MAEMSQAEEASTQATAPDSRPVYEVGFHLVPSIPEDALAGAFDKVKAMLGGAEVIAEGFAAKMTLAYAIERAAQGKREKFTSAYFGWVRFAAEEASAIPAIEAALRAEPSVLRCLLIHSTREIETKAPRAVFSSDRLEGETIKKMTEAESKGEVSEAQLEKSIEALTG